MKRPRLLKSGRRRGLPAIAVAGAAVLVFAGVFGAGSPDRPTDQSAAVRTQLIDQRVGENATRCDIKGNISSKGERIYHLPGQDYYSRTRIDTGKGERYFCSEAEARAAGWRRSKV